MIFKRKKTDKESREELIRQEYALWLRKIPTAIPEEKAIAYDAFVVLNEANTIVKLEQIQNQIEKKIRFLIYPKGSSNEPYFVFSVLLRGDVVEHYRIASSDEFYTIQEKTIEPFMDDVTIITSKKLYGNMPYYEHLEHCPVYQQTNRYKNNQLVTSEEKRYDHVVRQAFVDQENVFVKQEVNGEMRIPGNYITRNQFDKKYKGALKRTRKQPMKKEFK